MKFKVGDRVKVIARKHGHCFDIGKVVNIKEVNHEGYMCSSLERNKIWWLRDDEVAEVKFTKPDLKDKIEEIQEEGYWLFTTDRDSDKCVEVLQQLLEKE